MNHFPYSLETDNRPLLGLIVLQADETIEDEFRKLFDPDKVRLLVSRIPSGTALTPDTIAEMETALPNAAGLFPTGAHFAAVAYACTSGTSQIGAARVADLIRSRCNTDAVTNPLTASFAALRATYASRVGIISPYQTEVAATLISEFEHAGFTIPASLSFGEEIEANVARIAAASLIAAAHSLTRQTELDALFLSCTNLRTLDVIERLRNELTLPVLSSNTALAWHMSELAGVPQKLAP